MSLSLSKGITGASGTLTIFGQSIPNYLSSVFVSIVGGSPWSVSNPTTSFDLSNVGGLNDGNSANPAHYGINNEVVTGIATNDYAIYHDYTEAQNNGGIYYGSITMSIKWYRSRDNKLMWDGGSSTTVAPNSGFYYAIGDICWNIGWIGWITPEVGVYNQGVDTEIQENGDYYCKITFSGAYSKTETVNFTVSGIPTTNMAVDTQTTSSIGVHAWYQGTISVYTCKIFCNGTQISYQSYYGGTTNWATNTGTATGLSIGTPYDFYTIFYDADGYEVMQTKHFTFYTTAPQLATPYLSSFSSTTTSISFTIGDADSVYVDNYIVDWYKNGSHVGTRSQQNGSYSFTDLEPNCTYRFDYYVTAAEYSNSDTATSSIDTINPTPGIPTNNNNTPSDGQVTVTWNRPSSYTYLDGYKFSYRVSGGTWSSETTQDTTASTVITTFMGLTNDLTYEFRCRAYAYEGGYYYYSDYCVTTAIPGNTRPSQFTWDTSKISGQNFNIKATEWNRLIQNIKDIYTYKGIPSYTPTMYDVTAGSDFRAVNDFDKIKNAIGYFYNNTDPASGVGISDKNLGDTVYASYFDGDYSIVKKLNDIT